jgi:hypothetical protein
MIVACHLKEDISSLDESKCLLADPRGNMFLVCSNEERNHLGCYLHYNRNESVWICSGSANGEGGFGKRLKTHLERASSYRNDDDSRFYHSFHQNQVHVQILTRRKDTSITLLRTWGLAILWIVRQDAFLSQVGC